MLVGKAWKSIFPGASFFTSFHSNGSERPKPITSLDQGKEDVFGYLVFTNQPTGLLKDSRSRGSLAPSDGSSARQLAGPRLPRSVQTVYLRPLRRQAKHGIPTCDLQLRSYSIQNLQFFADFALRAAYYLNLPAHGPVPLPKLVERWTVPRSNFIFKKSQENFERITLRRLIQIRDGHPETVELWLAFLRKHAYYGVGMKANIWQFEELGLFLLFLRG